MKENGTPSMKRNKATIHPFRNTKEELELGLYVAKKKNQQIQNKPGF